MKISLKLFYSFLKLTTRLVFLFDYFLQELMPMLILFIITLVFLFVCSFFFKATSLRQYCINSTIHFINCESSAFSGDNSSSISFITQGDFNSIVNILAIKSVTQSKIKCNFGFFIGSFYEIEKSNSSFRRIKGSIHIASKLRNFIQNNAGCSS